MILTASIYASALGVEAASFFWRQQKKIQPKTRAAGNAQKEIIGFDYICNMQDLIKLIWDFRGPDSEMTAQHHERHLREFVTARNLSPGITGSERISDSYSLAFLVVSRADMIMVRDSLKPHRGEIYPLDPGQII